MRKLIISIAVATIAIVSCKSTEEPKVVAPLQSQTDSLAYIVGMNIADNLMAMDSTLNVEVVCRAIADRYAQNQLLTLSEARTYYLRYITHVEPELKRSYEEQYLADLVKGNRSFTRSKSGMAYNIVVIGNESMIPRNNNDLLSLRYAVRRTDGSEIFSSYQLGDTLVAPFSELNAGMQESLRMIGEGGQINSWIPSKLAYGEVGDSLLNVAPFETLYYEMELIKLEKNGASSARRSTTMGAW